MIKEPPHFGNDKPWMNQLKNWCRTVKDEFERTALRGDGVTTSISSGVVSALYTQYDGNFEVEKIDQDSAYIKLSDGIIKVKGLGYAVYTPGTATVSCYFPEVTADETFYIFIEVATNEFDVDEGIISGSNFLPSVNLLQDELSNGVFYIPIYKMIMKVVTINEVDTNIYSVIQDLRTMPIL